MSIKPLYLVMAAAALIAAAAPGLFTSRVAADELNRQIPAALSDPVNPAATETAVLAGGCFWGIQAVFEHVKGVNKVVAGYSGGSRADAVYEKVGRGNTGHAESVEITFNPQEVTYGRLLQVFFSVAHDPTQVGGQGPDRGPSYRSEIFAVTPAQADTAAAYIDQLEAAHIFAAPFTTKVVPLKGFYAAEDYHQDYLLYNLDDEYIRTNDLPKIAALKRVWPEVYKEVAMPLARNRH